MAKIVGLVSRRVANRSVTTDFYKLIGLESHEHRHGGPLHNEVGPVSQNFVVETYQRSATFDSDALLIEVEDLALVLKRLRDSGVVPHILLNNGQSVYIKDPDGYDILLIQA